MEEKKRKKGDATAVITFHAPGKSFQRVFKDQSFNELKNIVRKKAGIPANSDVRLAQLQGSVWIDIEDDDDYEAFCVLARFTPSLELSVAVDQTAHPTMDPATESISNFGSILKGKRKKHDLSSLRTNLLENSRERSRLGISSLTPGPSTTRGRLSGADFEAYADVDGDGDRPRKKRKKIKGSIARAESPVSLPTPISISGMAHDGSHPYEYGKRAGATRDPAPAHVPASPSIQTARKKKSKKSVEAVPVEPSSEPKASPTPSEEVQKVHRKHSGDVLPVADPLNEPQSKEKKRKRRSVPDAMFSGDKPHTSRSVLNDPVAASPPRKKAKRHNVPDVPTSSGCASPENERRRDISDDEREVRRKQGKKSKKSRVEEPDYGKAANVPAVSAEVSMAEGSYLQRPRKKKSKWKEGEETAGESRLPEPLASFVPTVPPAGSGQSGEGAQKKKKKKKKSMKSAETSEPRVLESSAEPAQTSSAEPGPEILKQTPSAARSSRKKTDATFADRKALTMSADEMMAVVKEAAAAMWAEQDAARILTAQAAVDVSPVEPKVRSDVKVHRKSKERPGKSKLSTSWKPDEPTTQVAVPVSDHLVAGVSPPAIPVDKANAAGSKRKSSVGKKGGRFREPSCPVCLNTSFHLRYLCPVVLAGADSIRRRIAELKKENRNAQLLEELEMLLTKAEKKSAVPLRSSSPDIAVKSRPSGITAPVNAPTRGSETKDTAQLSTRSSPTLVPSPSLAKASLAVRIPAGSEIVEVAVESKDEGSSDSDNSDDESVHRDVRAGLSVPSDASVTDIALDVLLRGPHKSGLRRSVLAQLPSESSSDSEDGSDEEDDDHEMEDEDDRKFRRLTKKYARVDSSDEDGDVVPPTFMDVDPQDAVLDQCDDVRDNATEPPNVSVDRPDTRPDDAVLAGADDHGVDGADVRDANETSSTKVDANVEDTVEGSPEVDQSVEGAKVSVEETATPPPTDGADEGEVSTSQPADDEETVPAADADSPARSLDLTGVNREQPGTADTSGDTDELTDVPTSPAVEDTELAEMSSGELATTELGCTTSSIIPTSSMNAPAETIESRFSEKPGSDDHTDSIEPADDLLDPKPAPVHEEHDDDDDPIEDEPETTPQRNLSALGLLKSPGTVQRMRDRFGRRANEKDLPVLASSLFDGAAAQSTPAPVRRGRASASGPADPPAVSQSQPEADAADTGAARQTRTSARRPLSSAAMPPPPAPASDTSTPSALAPAALAPSAPAPKRRGRPPLPQEEKDRRAAEKKSAQAKATAERAEKRRIEKAEKEEQKRRDKEEKARAKKPAKGDKAPSTPALTPAAITQDAPSTPQAAARAPVPVSQVKWAILTQEPSHVEPESSMFDELQSSPGHSLPRASSPAVDESADAETQAQLAAHATPVMAEKAKASAESGVADAPVQRSLVKSGRKSQLDGPDPLFLPGSSQYPETPLIAAAAVAIGARLHKPDESSESEEDEGGAQEKEEAEMEENDDDEDGEEDALKGPERSRTWTSMPFRTLTEIAGQKLFTPPALSRNSSFALRPVDSSPNQTPGGMPRPIEDDDEDDEDDESDDSEGEDEKQSHIPKERRAGAGVQKEKKSGLLAYAFG